MKHSLTFFFFLILSLQQLFAQIEVTDYGDIPANRIAENGWQNLEWDDSGSWTTIDVTNHGITPGSSQDIVDKVEAIIDGGSGKRILNFPAGTFQIKSTLNISKGDIQIVGAGSATKFMLEGGSTPGKIFAGGSRSGNYTLQNNVSRGDNTATLNSTSDLNVGDYFIIYQAGSVTRPGASGDETQIFKIIGKSGNTLTLDMKFGIPFLKDHARIEKCNYKKNLRFHNFYMEMTTDPSSSGKADNMALNTVQNVEISNIESNKAYATHIQIFRGREVILHSNNLYGNYGGGGGYQYGIKINFSTNCHIINNVASDLRHHFATQYGTDHCVIAYNRALPPYNHYADFGQHNSKGCHNNLFEGNYGSEIYDDANPLKSWGTRYTMWFRNHATSKVGSENAYVEYMSIIGNELTGGTSAIKEGNPGENTFTAANIVDIDGEGGNGNTLWGDLASDADIPASLFLANKPSYLNRWPYYGPDDSGSTEDVTPPVVSFNQPSGDINVDVDYSDLYVLVDATDNTGVENVELYIDGTFIRTESVDPYEWGHGGRTETLGLSEGNHTFTAVAKDAAGNSASESITVTVGSPAILPIVSFNSPSGDITLEAGYDQLIVQVGASDADGSISFVELFIDGNLIRRESVATYDWGHANSPNPDELLGLTPGVHTMTAIATDNEGNIGEASITITVTSPVDKIISGQIEAEEFDRQDGVQIGTGDTHDDAIVGYINTGDWMEYDVNVLEPGDYIVEIRYASRLNGLNFQLQFDGVTVDNVSEAATGDWSSYTTVSRNINIPSSGVQIMKINSTGNGYNLNWINFSKVNTSSSRVAVSKSKVTPTKKESSEQNIWVYPNPANNYFNISLGNISNAEISIFNSNGSLLYRTQTNQNTIKIQAGNLFTSGLYLIKVRDNFSGVTKTHKLLMK
ncbi:carbohydrate-binding protein [Flexithrix dorotheae]|uniref:carbohydrate-binding protein n=1 Tax=Flexithrix dorotheae TaxID=70993 RepID=UPI00036080D5|nr:carbohydrate-binding protein [Flexithrix dorotheae]